EDAGISLAADEGAQPVGDVHDTNGGDSQLKGREESGELDQANGCQTQIVTNGEDELGAPYLLQSIGRRGQHTQRLEAPEKGEVDRYRQHHRDCSGRELTHGTSPSRGIPA